MLTWPGASFSFSILTVLSHNLPSSSGNSPTCRRLQNVQAFAFISCCSSLAMSDVTNSSPSRAEIEFELLLPHQSELSVDPMTPPARTLQQRGVVRVNQGVSQEAALQLQKHIDRALETALEEIAAFRVPRAFRFANVLEKQNRWDLLLPFEPNQEESHAVMRVLDELLGPGRPIGSVFEECLGPNAILYELACLISDPGSKRQEIHPDILISDDHDDSNNGMPLIACFVSLQQVDATMGPTLYIPDTVTAMHHTRINNPNLADDMLASIPSVISTLGPGDCSLYDPRVLHAGGANQSDRRRRLFYVTFLSEAGKDPSHDFNPGSIQPELNMKSMTLAQMRESLEQWRKGKYL